MADVVYFITDMLFSSKLREAAKDKYAAEMEELRAHYAARKAAAVAD